MLKGLIEKMVDKAINAKMNAGTSDRSAEIQALQAEIATLKTEKDALQAKIDGSSAAKALVKLKEMAAGIPENAQGRGMIAVIENGVVKNVELNSRADLNAIITRAENGELEVLGS